MRRLSPVAFVLLLALSGCGGSKSSSPTAPPPDDPTPPVVTYVADFHDTTMVVYVTAQSDEWWLSGWSVNLQHQGQTVVTGDLTYEDRYLHEGLPKTLRIVTPSSPYKWVYDPSDRWYMAISVHRAGQKKEFRVDIHSGGGL